MTICWLVKISMLWPNLLKRRGTIGTLNIWYPIIKINNHQLIFGRSQLEVKTANKDKNDGLLFKVGKYQASDFKKRKPILKSS